MQMIGGGDCVGGCIVKMMEGMTVTELACGRFRRRPPLNIQPMASKRQPDKYQVKINAVVFNQGIQRVENGIEQFSGI